MNKNALIRAGEGGYLIDDFPKGYHPHRREVKWQTASRAICRMFQHATRLAARIGRLSDSRQARAQGSS